MDLASQIINLVDLYKKFIKNNLSVIIEMHLIIKNWCRNSHLIPQSKFIQSTWSYLVKYKHLKVKSI